MFERDEGGVATVSWERFRAMCQQRFGPPLGTNHLSDLARLPFRGSVDDYTESFLARLAHTGVLAPVQQVQLYMGGLPDPIRTDVELQMPADLQRAMMLARAYERRNVLVVLPATARPHRPQGRQYAAPPAVTAPAALPPATAPLALPAPPTPPWPFRRLTPAEMTERRRMGLCYNCDEQYVRGHRCARLFYLEVSDDVNEEAEPAIEQSILDDDHPLISLHAIAGIRTEETMQLKVTVGAHEFTALIDSGSTHNFISSSAAQRAGLVFHSSKGAHVTVANGDRVACRGLARDVGLRITQQGVGHEDFTLDCFTIPLDCHDMVLGIAFLRTLGPILWDFDDLCMAFWRGGCRVFWKGIGSTRTDIAPTGRLHSIRKDEPALLDRLLDSFQDVFAAPTGLPPARPCDHRIHLKPNTEPVAVRPYRYPQLQKDELEAQCTTMMAQGIIRPSTSPFSAPVLLVKKQDATWRFCVDYRALNSCTVKDKFPIPVVEELLDELHGAQFFTKLDLKSGYH